MQINKDFIPCIVSYAHEQEQPLKGRKAMKRKRMAALQLGLLMVGVTFVVYGTLRGEAETVLHKAVRICLECIGIG